MVSIDDVMMNEGDSRSTNVNFAIGLSYPSEKTITVNYETMDGTAVAGTDYSSVQGVVTFAPGETKKRVLVPIDGDTVFENNETFQLKLSMPLNASMLNESGTATIINDDPSGNKR